MRRALIGGMLTCLIGCVVAGLADMGVLAFGAALGGLALLAVAVEHSRPVHWPPSENERAASDERSR